MVEHHSKEKVLITGITGYIASQVTHYFLKDGGFEIRGTVRDPSNADKLAPLKKAFGEEDFSKIELAKADLLDADSIDKAVQGCKYVVHCASPLPTKQPDDEQVLIKPAVEGTLAVLRAAHKHGVKRVVVTSSCLAIFQKFRENHKASYNEEDWADEGACAPYDKSKLLAERAAWDFHKSLPDAERFELVLCLPALVLGPNLVPGEFSSQNYMKMMLMGVMPGLPKMWFPIVDVRDVAQAHLNAIKVPEAANKRFALCRDTYTFKELCEKIIEKYGDKYPTHTREMEECPPENVRFKNAWGHHWKLDNTRSTSILGIKYHDVKDTLVDMTEALISHSMIPDNRNK